MSLIYEFLVLVYMGIKTKYLISIDDVINSSKANNSILHYNKIISFMISRHLRTTVINFKRFYIIDSRQINILGRKNTHEEIHSARINLIF